MTTRVTTDRPRRVGIIAHPELFSDSDGDKMLHFVAAAPYVKAVHKAGGLPLILPIVDADNVDSLFDAIDAIVITGGCDVDPARYGAAPDPQLGAINPARDLSDLAVARAVVERNFPTLAVCRGIQVVNVALGGTLTQHVEHHMRIDAYNQGVHRVDIQPSSQLATIVGTTDLWVNTLHHQVIQRLGTGVRATAWNPDGHVEAIEIDDAPNVNAVQWHPELLRHEREHLALFQQLVGA